MSNETITLEATKREVLGKQVRGLRNVGNTPAVVHDHGKQSLHITVVEKELKKAFLTAGKHTPVALKIDGKTYTTIIKDVTHKPASAKVLHTVFQAINATETVKAEVPVQLVGEIPAEKLSLLVLQNLDHVEVEALSKDLVDAIEIDASGLTEPGDKLHVSDIKAPHGVVIMTDSELVIAAVEMPKDQIAEADAAQAELAADAGADESAEASNDETTEAATEESEDSAK